MLVTFDRNSNILRVALKHSSTGAGLTGLAYNTSGLIISTITDAEGTAVVYTVAASNVEDITTIGTYSAPTASKCRFKAVDATNHPGLYEIHLADARFSVANATKLIVSIHGAANLLQADLVIDLTRFDHDVATQSVNVTQFGGSAGTFASGRPEVNTTHISGDSGAADNLETILDGTSDAVDLLEFLRGANSILMGDASGLNGGTRTFRDRANTKDVHVVTITASTRAFVSDLT